MLSTKDVFSMATLPAEQARPKFFLPTCGVILINAKRLIGDMLASTAKDSISTPNNPNGELEKEPRLIEELSVLSNGPKNKELIGALFSCTMSWGTDAELDKFCTEELKLTRSHDFVFGTKGAGGYLSFPIKNSNISSEWSISSTMTGQRLLMIVAMVRSLVANYNLPCDISKLMRKFASVIPENSVDIYPPSLSFLIKFWQDAIRNLNP